MLSAQNNMEWVMLMKLDFKRYLMSVLFTVMPAVILADAVKVKIEPVPVMLTMAAVLTLISMLYIKNRYVRLITLVLMAVLMLLTNNISEIIQGIEEISDRYGSIMQMYKSGEEIMVSGGHTDSINAVIRLYIEIVLPCLFAVYKNKMWKIVYLAVTIPFIILLLSVGLAPSVTEVYILVFMYANMVIEKSSKKNELDINTVRVNILKNVYVNIIFVIVFLALIIINSIKPYERSEKFDEYKNTLNAYLTGERSLIDDLKEGIGFGGSGAGGMNNGRLGSVDEIIFSGEDKLKISYLSEEVFKQNTIYVKSFIGAEYTGDKWKSAGNDINIKVNDIQDYYGKSMAEIDEITAVLIKNSNVMSDAQKKYEKIEITILDNNKKNVYWPYYCFTKMSSVSDGQKTSDEKENSREFKIYSQYQLPSSAEWADYIASCGVNAYETDCGDYYLQNYSNKIPDETIEAAEILKDYYEDVAVRYYLEVPEKFNETAEKILDERISDYVTNLSEIGIYDEKVKELSVEEAGYQVFIDYVKEYLDRNCKYSLKPGKLQDGEDFVLKFLNETKKGYCSHFASSATLIFRAMGIPARYVEGYAAYNNPVDGVIMVKDSSAHAWVEIFVRGIGWIPVEVTPAYYKDIIEDSIGESEKEIIEKDTTKPLESTSKEPVYETDNTTGTDEASTAVTETSSQPEEFFGENGTDKAEASKDENIFGKISLILKAAAIFAVIVCIIFMILCTRRIKKRKSFKKLLSGSDVKNIYSIFYKQLEYVLYIRKVKLNMLESAEKIKTAIMLADGKTDEELALRLAEIIIKGHYSNEALTDEEIKTLVYATGKIARDVYKESGFIRKLNLYYIKCLYLSEK